MEVRVDHVADDMAEALATLAQRTNDLQVARRARHDQQQLAFAQVLVHGDKRNFVTALVTLDEEAAMKWAKETGYNGKGYADIAQSPEIKQLLDPYFQEVNKTLAKYETVKQFAVLPKDLTVDEGELTPSLKVKRKVVESKYASVLDKMYEGSVADMG